MKNLKKAAKIAALAFRNGIRLHKDSILMYHNDSIPTAYQLSILAQEEIGKAFILEEHVFRAHEHSGESDPPYHGMPEIQKWLTNDLISHKNKQVWFSRQVDDIWYGEKFVTPKFMQDALSGALEQEKQNATYVGLTKKGKVINLNGKIINPENRVKKEKVKRHITRVNDFVIVLIEGCRRHTQMVDTDELDAELKMELVVDLEKLWQHKSLYTYRQLKKIRKFEIEQD